MNRRTFLTAIAAVAVSVKSAFRESLAYVTARQDIDAIGPQINVDGLPYLELDWQALRFVGLDTSGRDNELLEAEFWVVDREQEKHIQAYMHWDGVGQGLPVHVLKLSTRAEERIVCKCILAEKWKPHHIVQGRPNLYRMHLLYPLVETQHGQL